MGVIDSHGVPVLCGDWAGSIGQLRTRLWQAGGDRGCNQSEPRSDRCAGHGMHANQFQAPLSHGHHHSGVVMHAAKESATQGLRGGGSGVEVGK